MNPPLACWPFLLASYRLVFKVRLRRHLVQTLERLVHALNITRLWIFSHDQ